MIQTNYFHLLKEGNEAAAYELVCSAAEELDPIALFSLGTYHSKGEGGANNELAIRYYVKAAEEGRLLRANKLLADTLCNGTEFIHSETIGLSYAMRSACFGDAKNQHRIGVHYLDQYEETKTQYALENAIFWLKKSALQGHPLSQFVLSLLYGQKDDRMLQTFWLTKSADAGHASAEISLGQRLCASGNYDDGLPLLRSASRKRNKRAQYLLGRLLITEKGLKSYLDEGLMWLEQAHLNGHSQAGDLLIEGAIEKVKMEENELNLTGYVTEMQDLEPGYQKNKYPSLTERLMLHTGKEWQVSGGVGLGILSPFIVDACDSSFNDFQEEFIADLYSLMNIEYEVLESKVDNFCSGYVLSKLKPIAGPPEDYLMDVRFFDYSKLGMQRLNIQKRDFLSVLNQHLSFPTLDMNEWRGSLVEENHLHLRLESWGDDPNRPLPVLLEIEEVTDYFLSSDHKSFHVESEDTQTRAEERFSKFLDNLNLELKESGPPRVETVAGCDSIVVRSKVFKRTRNQTFDSFSITLSNQGRVYRFDFLIDLQYRDELLEPVTNAIESMVFVEYHQEKTGADYGHEITALVKSHLNVYHEVEAMDSVFRFRLNEKTSKTKSPWIMLGRRELQLEELQVWRELDKGEISDAQAIEKFSRLMERYYAPNS